MLPSCRFFRRSRREMATCVTFSRRAISLWLTFSASLSSANSIFLSSACTRRRTRPRDATGIVAVIRSLNFFAISNQPFLLYLPQILAINLVGQRHQLFGPSFAALDPADQQ